MKKYLSTNISDYFEAEITVATKRVDYLFVITGLDGEKVVYTDQGMFDYDESLVTKKYGAFCLPYFHESDRFKAPEWVKETVWYQISLNVLPMGIRAMILREQKLGIHKMFLTVKIFMGEICKG